MGTRHGACDAVDAVALWARIPSSVLHLTGQSATANFNKYFCCALQRWLCGRRQGRGPRKSCFPAASFVAM